MGNHDFTCAILAGGKATRFNGSNKALLQVGSKTNLDKIIEISENLFSEILLVTNSPDLYKSYQNIRIVEDIIKDFGPLSGIHSALFHAKSPAVFMFPCDMPFVSKKLVLEEIDEFINNDYDLIVPRIIDFFEPLHSIYKSSLHTKLEEHIKSSADRSVRAFFNKINPYYWDLEVTEEIRIAFLNINTHHDYKKALETHAEKDK